jgi:hypothetical protein
LTIVLTEEEDKENDSNYSLSHKTNFQRIKSKTLDSSESFSFSVNSSNSTDKLDCKLSFALSQLLMTPTHGSDDFLNSLLSSPIVENSPSSTSSVLSAPTSSEVSSLPVMDYPPYFSAENTSYLEKIFMALKAAPFSPPNASLTDPSITYFKLGSKVAVKFNADSLSGSQSSYFFAEISGVFPMPCGVLETDWCVCFNCILLVCVFVLILFY